MSEISLPASRPRTGHGEGNSAEYWKKALAPFRGADTRRSIIQLTTTAIAFVALWTAMLFSLEVHYALTLVLAFPTAGFLVRLFMIQHDCGHGSYFRSRRARDWVGFCIGVVTLVPYQYWRRTHAHHHAHTGDLDFRGFGDIDTLTLEEYRALTPLKRLGYRLYRNPIILLTIGPVFQFVIKHRYPWDIPRSWTQAWASVWWTNACLVGIVLLMSATIGLERFLLVQAPVTAISGSIGVWLFYVQHQFEETYWHHNEDWDFFDAALHGSSHLVLPKPLQWMTAHIGLHHIHHLNATIPNYRLPECLEADERLQQATKITFADSWRLLNLTLWDEESQRLIGFREAKRRMAS